MQNCFGVETYLPFGAKHPQLCQGREGGAVGLEQLTKGEPRYRGGALCMISPLMMAIFSRILIPGGYQ